MKIKLVRILGLVVFVVFVSFGCQEDAVIDTESTIANVSTELNEDALLRKQMSDVVAKIANDDDVIAEVSKAVEMEYYGEEAVLMVDLLEESNTTLKSIAPSSFRSKFYEALNSDFKSVAFQNEEDLIDLLKQGKVQLYWPYHEDWDGFSKPTITFHDGINEDENIGYKSDGTEVIVNDEYAMTNPVWIINFKEFDGSYEEVVAYYKERNSKKSETVLKSAEALVYTTHIIKQAQCNTQYDGVFNGGSEIRFVRVGLKDPWHADISDFLMGHDFSRADIKYNRWKIMNAVWDSQWESTLDYQVIGVYEEDYGSTEITIDGNVKGSYTYQEDGVDVTVAVNSDVSYKYKSDNQMLYKNSWGREWAAANLGFYKTIGFGNVQTLWMNALE